VGAGAASEVSDGARVARRVVGSVRRAGRGAVRGAV